MKQIWIRKAGEPDVLQIQDLPDPIPRTGEVRIRVAACGINFADVLGRMGIYPDAPKIPYVPGYEVAGRIDAVGQGVAGLKEGDEVMALTYFGGYSDVVCVPQKHVFRRLDWMPAEDGAAIPLNYLTAYLMLVVMGSLRQGSRVLIHGAAGGVGLAALDICRIVGATTFGTASPGKHAFLAERGLNHAVDYRRWDYERVLNDLTNQQGMDIILDPLGGVHWQKNYRLLQPTGRLICFGASSVSTGKRRSLRGMARLLFTMRYYSPLRLMNDNKGVLGFNLPRMWEEVAVQREGMQQLIGWYDEALFRPHIDTVFRFDQVAEAHHYLQDRKNVGKLLLVP